MGLRSNAFVLVPAGVLGLLLVGCSSGSEDQPGGSWDGDAATDSQPSDAEPDAEADAADAADAASNCLPVTGAVFAVDTLYFGDMDWDGNVDPSAWRLFGSDLDGVDSTAVSTGLCQPAAGALAEDVYPDGEDGVDNAFGRAVLPLLSTVSPDFSERVNGSVATGSFTWLLKIDPYGTQPNQSSVTTKVYAGDSLSAPPRFDGSDCWPVTAASLEDPSDFESAKASFPDGEIVASRLDTGSPDDLQLAVPISGTVLRLTAHHARIAVEFEEDPNVPTRGMISGVVDTDEFIEEARDVLGFLDPTMCSGPTFDMVASSIRKASDIMKNGTQDPSATCNGISVGIGFTMGRAGFSGLGSASPAGSDPCL
jgi:hypothetical protein